MQCTVIFLEMIDDCIMQPCGAVLFVNMATFIVVTRCDTLQYALIFIEFEWKDKLHVYYQLFILYELICKT